MNKIFYFTGTGNSLQVSQDMAKELEHCEVIPLAGYDISKVITAERVGIVFPIYFWGLPLIVEKFLEDIKMNSTYVFLIATYGIWPGKALDQAANILSARNIKVDSGYFIKMPDNYILSYGARSEKSQYRCFKNEKMKIEAISKIIIQKKNETIEKSKYQIDRLFTDLVYKSVAKKFSKTDEKFAADSNCVGCGLCVKVCPVSNIELVNGKPSWNHRCEACLACIQRCPAQAINYNNKTQKRRRYINPNVTF